MGTSRAAGRGQQLVVVAHTRRFFGCALKLRDGHVGPLEAYPYLQGCSLFQVPEAPIASW